MRIFPKRMALICLIALLYAGSSLCLAQGTVVHTQFVYGQSESGRNLICHRVGREDASRSILMVFGVHGFEDAFDHDGEVLQMIAESIISHYASHAEELQDFCLYIIPSANPDGLIDGTTKDGFGRCNANGLDINRDFPFDWKENTTSRNQTGQEPLSTAEARAICDLVETIHPDYGIDVHGWKKGSYGNGKMAEIFAMPFRFKVKRLSTEGMLGAWLHSETDEGILIELPPEPDKEDYVTDNTARLMEGLNAWMAYCSPEK